MSPYQEGRENIDLVRILLALMLALARLKNQLNLHGYSKTCVKRSLKNRQNKDLNDKW